MAVIIYHNPRGSRGQATLKLLQRHGIEPQIGRGSVAGLRPSSNGFRVEAATTAIG